MSPNTHRHFLSAISSGIGVSIVKVVTSIITIPFLLAHLDRETFGLYVLLVGFVDLFMLLDVMSGGIVRLILELRAKTKTDAAEQLLGAGHAGFIALTLVLMTLGWFSSPLLIHLVNLPAALIPLALLAFKTILFENLMHFYSSYHQAILRIHHRNYWTNFADLIFSVGNCAAVFVLVGNGVDLEWVFLTRIGLAIGKMLIIAIHSHAIEPALFRLKASIEKATWKQLSFYMTYSAVSNGSSILSSRLDNLIIANLTQLNLVGLNDILTRILSPIILIAFRIMENVYPVIFKLNAEENHGVMRQFFLRVSSYLSALCIFFLSAVLIFIPNLLDYFSAGKFKMTALLWVAVSMKSAYLWSLIIGLPAVQYLYARNHHRFIVTLSLIVSLVTFGLSLTLTPIFGIAGVALGGLIPQSIQYHLLLLPRARQGLTISLIEHSQHLVLGGLPAFVVFIGLLLVLKPIITSLAMPLVFIALACCLALAISAPIWFQLTATAEEKSILRHSIQKLMPRYGLS